MSAGAQAAVPDPSCTFPAQPTVAFRPAGAMRRRRRIGARGWVRRWCERNTGSQGMEPMLAVNRGDTMLMGMATDEGLYEDPGRLTPARRRTPCCAAATTAGRGGGSRCRRHRRVRGVPVRGPGHGPAVRDVRVRRHDTLRPAGGLQRRRGEHWTQAAGRPGCSPPTAGDWPKIFAGPHRVRPADGYPDAVYLCNFIPNILVAASIGCWRSDDGATTSSSPASSPRSTARATPAASRTAPARPSSTAADAFCPTGSSSCR